MRTSVRVGWGAAALLLAAGPAIGQAPAPGEAIVSTYHPVAQAAPQPGVWGRFAPNAPAGAPRPAPRIELVEETGVKGVKATVELADAAPPPAASHAAAAIALGAEHPQTPGPAHPPVKNSFWHRCV